MAKDAYYFSHDSNARNDIRIIKLRRKLGLKGYGMYWCIIEMLRESENYKLSLTDLEDIAYELRCEIEEINVLFECELLEKDNEYFYSKSLLKRMEKLDKIKQKRRDAGAIGGKSKAKGKQMLSNSEAIKVKQSKEEESIVKNSKEDEEEKPEPSPPIESTNEIYNRLQIDNNYIGIVSNLTERKPPDVLKFLEKFKMHLVATKNTMKTEKDFREHFLNWIKKQKDEQTNQDKPDRFEQIKNW
jgi:hypothetical protein